MTLSILRLADLDPEAPFILSPQEVQTRQQIAQQASAFASWLVCRVEPRTDRPLAFVATLEPRTIVVLLALFELGIPAVPIHPSFTPGEARQAAASIGAEWLDVPEGPWPASGDTRDAKPPRALDPERTLAVIFTSGSTGAPRGVRLSQRAFTFSARATTRALGIGPADRWALCLPLAHVGGLSILTRCLYSGAALVIPGSTPVRRFDPAALHQSLAACGATLLSIVPTQLHALLEHGLPCPKKLRAVVVGGAATSGPLLELARGAGWPLLRSYGSSETCAQVTLERPGQGSALPGAVGPALPDVEVRVLNGRVWIRSPSLASGYLPDAPLDVDADGWLRTSDVGELCADGTLCITGRADEVIITGGENVQPEQVERVLAEHPSIVAACVFAVASERWGQEIAAALELREDATATSSGPADFGVWLSGRLAPFRRPRWVIVLPALPLTASGKLDRKACRELAARCVPIP